MSPILGVGSHVAADPQSPQEGIVTPEPERADQAESQHYSPPQSPSDLAVESLSSPLDQPCHPGCVCNGISPHLLEASLTLKLTHSEIHHRVMLYSGECFKHFLLETLSVSLYNIYAIR